MKLCRSKLLVKPIPIISCLLSGALVSTVRLIGSMLTKLPWLFLLKSSILLFRIASGVSHFFHGRNFPGYSLKFSKFDPSFVEWSLNRFGVAVVDSKGA